MMRALIETAMRGLVRFRSRAAREEFFKRLAILERFANTPDAELDKPTRHRRASQYFRQHGEHYDA
jgi:hypothetical protein